MAETVRTALADALDCCEATLARIERGIDDFSVGIGNLEGALVSIKRHVMALSAGRARQQVAIDDVGRRLDRIERRLGPTS